VKAYLNDLASLQAKLQPLSLKLTQGMDAAEAFILLLKKDQTPKLSTNPIAFLKSIC